MAQSVSYTHLDAIVERGSSPRGVVWLLSKDEKYVLILGLVLF